MNDIKIDENNLSMEMANQAANFLYVAEQAAKAEAVYDTIKFAMDQLVAELDMEVREKATDAGKKITEKLVEMEVERDQRHKDMKLRVIKVKAEMNMVKAKRDAWYQRKDMLIQLAIKERNEIAAITGGTVSAQDAAGYTCMAER